MFSSAAGDDPAAEPPELGGFLPIQEDELEVELAAFEEPEFLEDVPVGEGEVSDEVEEVLYGDDIIEALGEFQIPQVAIEAYNDAADVQEEADPQCGIRWSLLAAIGSVESGHGTFGGAKLREDGYGTKPIRGIPLDGRPNVALIRDTDNGELDGDTTFDRAVGPMQFIPSTWRSVGQDGNDDGKSDPNNIFDATRGASAYLCAGDANLDDIAARARAVRRYNNADDYVRVVLRLAMKYETGRVEPLPDVPVPPAVATPSAPRSTPPRPTPTPTPAPSPTVPASAPTTTTTVPPDPTSTTIPAPVDPAESTDPQEPSDPDEPVAELPAAVGWAPAMREVVVGILTPDECPTVPGTPTTVGPGPEVCADPEESSGG